MRSIDAKELEKILELHETWLHSGGTRGKRADMKGGQG